MSMPGRLQKNPNIGGSISSLEPFRTFHGENAYYKVLLNKFNDDVTKPAYFLKLGGISMNIPYRVTVAAILQRGDKFLLVEEEDSGQRVLNQPAGHVEPGETLIQAVIRETLEETAWSVTPLSLVGLYHWVHPEKQLTFLRALFHVRGDNHNIDAIIDPDIIGNHWLTWPELQHPRLAMRSPMVLQGFQDFLAGKQYPLEILVNLP